MTKIKRVLIANRGEIAVRIIHACKELGIETISIYSTADKESLHVALADYSICVGPGPVQESYLNMERIISAAVALAVDAIHPGYGFLSENSKFAKMCEECNIIFIGPSSKTIEMAGNKSKAREIMQANGVPVIPGSDGIVHSLEEANEVASSIGFPVIVKASLGGGGKGMRIIESNEDMEKFLRQARAEAKNAFGDASIYIEKYITSSRHIEFQILADSYGNVVHLNDRECSIQRKNQKVIEEAPASCIDEHLRKEMGKTAIEAAKAIQYVNAGTIEFLLDEDHHFYFMEMNTRIQVEHPITEIITGIDLIKQQIKIAEGDPLPFKQEEIKINGHAIECRINAEDPEHDFAPCSGKINELHLPGGMGIRVDTHIFQNYSIPIYYDSMIAKLIAWGDNRHDAIEKMKVALDEVIIDGVKTNIPLLKTVMENQDFYDGKITTKFLDKLLR